MPTILSISASLLILTKFLDCWTTQRYMAHAGLEKNRWARKWMLKYGKEKVIWGVFAFTVLIVVLVLWEIFRNAHGVIYQIAFISSAIIISNAQFFVALSNYQQKHNWFTKILSRWKFYA